jgi:hypothetical protein
MNIENLNKSADTLHVLLVSICFMADWPLNGQSSTANLKFEGCLRSASIVGWDFCLVRQDQSETTIYAKPFDHL